MTSGYVDDIAHSEQDGLDDLPYYMPFFSLELTEQLRADKQKWGNTWITRGRKGQEIRFLVWLLKKYLRWFIFREPIPWLKISGEAFIGRVRQTYRSEVVSK